MKKLSDGVAIEFPCSQWLAEDEGDGQLFRDLVPRADQMLASQIPQSRATYK